MFCPITRKDPSKSRLDSIVAQKKTLFLGIDIILLCPKRNSEIYDCKNIFILSECSFIVNIDESGKKCDAFCASVYNFQIIILFSSFQYKFQRIELIHSNLALNQNVTWLNGLDYHWIQLQFTTVQCKIQNVVFGFIVNSGQSLFCLVLYVKWVTLYKNTA